MSSSIVVREAYLATMRRTLFSVLRFTLHEIRSSLLRFRHDVSIRLFNAVDRMDLRDDDIGERPLILYADEDKNVGAPEAGVSLFYAGNAFQRADYLVGFSRFHFDENVGFCCHVSLLVGCVVREA